MGVALLGTLQLGMIAASSTAATIDLGQYFSAHLPKPAPPPPAVADPNQQFRLDLAYLARELPHVYAGGDGLKHISAGEFRGEVAAIEQRLPTLSQPQLLVRILQLLAKLRDGETGMVLPPDQQLPVTVEWFGTQLRLLAVPPEDRGLLGREVVAIDDTPVDKVHTLLRTVIPAVTDWESDSVFPDYVRETDILQGLGIIDDPAQVRLTVRSDGGHVQTVTLDTALVDGSDPTAGLVGPPPTFASSHGDRPYWWQYLPTSNVVYIRYNSCVDGAGFGRLADAAIAAMRSHDNARLVVDFRGNGGGNSAPFQRLLDDLHHDSKLERPGRIYGLIDRHTFSSATLNAVQLQSDAHGLLVGQPTGDPVNQWGNQRYLYLTGFLPVHYSTHYFDPARRYHHKPYVAPDVPVATTLADLLSGADPVLQTVERKGK